MIRIENLTFHYPNTIEAALRSIDLNVVDGEAVAIMGTNGSGKSTFAKILTKLLKPVRGVINIEIDDNISNVGLVFQNPDNQMVALTVEKELAFSLENLGYPLEVMEQKITESLKQFELTLFRKRIISDLSGGEKQRVAVASVMITEPDVLILDEPDSFLDYHGKQLLLDQIRIIKKNNPQLIILHITQYVEIAKLYSRMLLFSQGEIIADKSPDEIFAGKYALFNTDLIKRNKSYDYQNLIKKVSLLSKTIHVENLSFQYIEEKELLRNISFTLSQGEIIGMVGRSGSGKSTLASLLCGLIPMQLGNLKVSQPDKTLDLSSMITMLFQQPENQFFLPTIEKEISFGLKNRKIKFSRQQIFDLMHLVGLDYKKICLRDPQTLSGGEKRRLAFAVVLSLSFDFIIFDEPSCGLDLLGVAMFSDLVENLKMMQKGLILISHDLDLLKSVADSILYLHQNGTAEVFTRKEFFESSLYRQMSLNQEKNDFFA